MNLTVQIGKMRMQNPVTVASGTFGYGVEYSRLNDLNQLVFIRFHVVQADVLLPAFPAHDVIHRARIFATQRNTHS